MEPGSTLSDANPGAVADRDASEGVIDDTDALFRLANRIAMPARAAISLSVGFMLIVANTVFRLGLPILWLLVLSFFELLVNQPHPFLRRRLGSQKRLYLLSVAVDIVILSITAVLIGSLINRFAVLLFFVSIIAISLIVLRFFRTGPRS